MLNGLDLLDVVPNPKIFVEAIQVLTHEKRRVDAIRKISGKLGIMIIDGTRKKIKVQLSRIC